MNLEVELKDHIGELVTDLGSVQASLGQYQVLVNKKLVGYLDKKPGFGIKLLSTVKVPDDVKAIIKSKVDEILGRETTSIASSGHILEEAFGDDNDEE